MTKRHKATSDLSEKSKDPMAVINKKGCVFPIRDFTEEVLQEVMSTLTVKPAINPDYQFKPVEEYPIYKRDAESIYLPRFFAKSKLGSFPEDFPVLPKRFKMNSLISLRDYQVPVVTAAIKALETKGGGILACGTGTGKTSMALHIACHFRVKTMIIVHKSFLLQQWKSRIADFVPDAKIGHIQGAVCDIDNKDFVLCMLQSLATKTYDPAIFADIGLVIADECHHLSAEVFCRALPKVASQYMLGLSATPQRKDGLTKVFKWYLGDIAYTYVRTDTDSVLVKRIVFSNGDGDWGKERRNFRHGLSLARMVNDIAATTNRNEIVLHEAEQYVAEERQVMIISDRLGHLDELKKAIDQKNIQKNGKTVFTGFYTGKQKQKELEKNESCDIIFSTYGLVREGLDIQSLNTIILATPISDVVQTCGRIMRKQHACNPLVVDIVDSYSIFYSQAKKRLSFYDKSKYNVFPVYYDGKKDKLSKLSLSTADMQQAIIDRQSSTSDDDNDGGVQTLNNATTNGFLSDSD